jgi:hypothetical protein
MSEVISNIGGFFKTAAPAIGGATAGAGLIGKVLNSIQRGKEVGKLQDAEKKFTSLTPEQLSGMVTKAEQPLGNDLLQNVGNLVQADLGTRGLSQAPGIFAAEEAQTLAPYKLQEQRMALELVMKQLGLPIEYAQAILSGMGGPSNVSPLLQLLMKGGGAPSSDASSPSVKQLLSLFNAGTGSPGLTNTPDSPTGWLGDTPPVDAGGIPA